MKITVVISVSLPDNLMKRLNKLMKERGYYSRSEAVRDALRSMISEAEVESGDYEKVAATIMVTCDYEKRDVDMRMTKIRHEFDDVVIENLHRHIGNKYCLEVFIVEGSSKRVLALLGRLRGIRGIYQVKSILLPL